MSVCDQEVMGSNPSWVELQLGRTFVEPEPTPTAPSPPPKSKPILLTQALNERRKLIADKFL